jgi:hypothetical protein
MMIEEISMSELSLKTPQVSRQVEQLNVPVFKTESEVAAGTQQNRIPLTVRSRHKVLRVAPPVDDGFRPFRVF